MAWQADRVENIGSPQYTLNLHVQSCFCFLTVTGVFSSIYVLVQTLTTSVFLLEGLCSSKRMTPPIHFV